MDPQQTTTTSRSDNDVARQEPTNIVKRKRTGRQRPAIVIVTHSSTSNNAFNSSQTSSSDFWTRSTTTTEDEDTANCLILLSKGDNDINIPPKNITNNNMDEFIGHKFTSKRYIQTSTDAVNGSNTSRGTYVYECKTCGRTFTSFQALGGHRASHTKPKNNEIEKRKPPSYTAFSDEANNDQSPQFESRKNNYSPSSSLSLQINHKVSFKKSSSKLHECSICGAEFNSGQALGGHMRRHRATNGNGNVNVNGDATNTTLSLIPYSPATSVVADDRDDQKLIMNDGLCLDLDLNLPAPSEKGSVGVFSHDQHERESSFKFTANHINKQQHLSAVPTLVGCHY